MVPSRPPRTFTARISACLGAACLAVVFPVQARHPDLNLHDMADAQFLHLIDEELGDDDLEECGFHDLGKAHTIQQAFDAVMCALGDEGDEGEETAMDFDDLEDEMERDGTTVEKVVRAAIEEADRRAGGTGSVLLVAVRDGLLGPQSDADRDVPVWFAQIKNGLINPPTSNIKAPVKEGLNKARKN